MTEDAQSTTKRAAIGKGISFQPDLWDRLEAEAARMERPNRSVIVERALKLYFAVEDQKREAQAERLQGVA